MGNYSLPYQSQLYKEFKELEPAAYRDIISFVDKNNRELSTLHFDEQFDLYLTYGTALFETGEYDRYISLADDLIEMTIHLNIKYFQGIDIYPRLLFKKAAAAFQLHHFDHAEHILQELIRMNPTNKMAVFLLKKVRLQKPSPFLTNVKGICIFTFLFVAALIGIEIILIRPFYPEWKVFMEIGRTALFVSGIAFLVLADLYQRIISYRSVDKLVLSEKERAKKKSEAASSEKKYDY